MNLIESVLLGAIQGTTEWLPVSSEGVLSLFMINFLGKTFQESIYLSIWLHTGTLLAAAIYFRKDLAAILKNLPFYLKNLRKNTDENTTTSFLVISTIFTGVIGLPLMVFGIDKINISWEIGTGLIGFFLILTGIMQGLGKKIRVAGKKLRTTDSVPAGIAQAFSILPGISRSGITTSVLLFRKYEAREALRISFLMSIPAVIAAEFGLGVMGKLSFGLESFAAIVSSFAFGLITIGCLMKLARKINFGWFCILLGIASIISVFLV